MTFEEMKNLSDKEQKDLFNKLKEKRHKAKTTNFSSFYGVGAEKLDRELGIKVMDAKRLLIGYWLRNKAVKQVAEACKVKEIKGQKWLLNPVSKFWYSLRAEKDRFSTLNQGTGVFCFDSWIMRVRKKGIKISMQMHDEILFKMKGKSKEEINKFLQEAIKETNDYLKLNVPLGISVEFGKDYASVH